MKKLSILMVTLFTFFVMLRNGQTFVVLGAQGLGIVPKGYTEEIKEDMLSFFDQETNILRTIPLSQFGAAVYGPDEKAVAPGLNL